MYKLLLLDIDGTLRHEVYGIPSSAKIAIQQCRKQGCLVVICTGRSWGTISDDVLSLDVDGYISGGGCSIRYHKKLLKNSSFPQNKIDEVVRILKNDDVAFTLESEEKVYMNTKAKEILNQMNLHKAKNIKNSQKQYVQEKIIYENNLEQFHNQAIHKICLWDEGNTYSKVALSLGNCMEIAQQDELASQTYVEIIQRGNHKGDAIHLLQSHLGISQAETICFGDGLNDVEMFRFSAWRVAMENAHSDLQRLSDSVCEEIMDDGIYLELKRKGMVA